MYLFLSTNSRIPFNNFPDHKLFTLGLYRTRRWSNRHGTGRRVHIWQGLRRRNHARVEAHGGGRLVHGEQRRGHQEQRQSILFDPRPGSVARWQTFHIWSRVIWHARVVFDGQSDHGQERQTHGGPAHHSRQCLLIGYAINSALA